MPGTTSSIANLIRDGNMTLADCAARLGITREQLENRLHFMERQGYLARVADNGDDCACTCGHCCATCSRKSAGRLPGIYFLTAKGERLLVLQSRPE